jgi:sulfur carrier protein ThiS
MVTKKVRQTALQEQVTGRGPINLMFIQLTKPLEQVALQRAVTITEFLERRNLAFSSAVRVNKRVVGRDYMVKNKDVITVISKVSGGAL